MDNAFLKGGFMIRLTLALGLACFYFATIAHGSLSKVLLILGMLSVAVFAASVFLRLLTRD